MKKISLITTVLAMSCVSLFSQNTAGEQKKEEKKSVKFDMAGQVTIAKDFQSNIFLTCGGPTIKIGRGKVALNMGLFPSLRYNYQYSETVDKTPVVTILGTGAQLSYGHITAGCLFYLNKNLWYAAPAIGYKFK